MIVFIFIAASYTVSLLFGLLTIQSFHQPYWPVSALMCLVFAYVGSTMLYFYLKGLS